MSAVIQAVKRYKKILDRLHRGRSRGVDYRLNRIERMLTGPVVRMDTLYQKSYASSRRRGDSTRRTLSKARALIKQMERASEMSIKMGKIIGSLKHDRMVVTLPLKKFHRLHYILRPKRCGWSAPRGAAGCRAVFLNKASTESLKIMLEAVRRTKHNRS